MSMLDIVNNKISSNKFGPMDHDWVQFINDHKYHIKQNAQRRVISEDYFRKHEYNLNSYLRSISTNTSLTWIVKLINGILTDVDFVMLSTIYIPDEKNIKDLYKTYKTLQSKKNKLK